MASREYYNRFIEASKLWVPVLYIQRDRTSQEWFDFVRYMSKSAMAFYCFHTTLKQKIYREDDYPKRIYNFYADLIISRLKRAIFTENPRDSVQDISAISFEDFKDAFANLTPKDDGQPVKLEKYDLYYYYLKAFCYFDMVFFRDSIKVFFCRYQPIAEVRIQFCGYLDKLLKDLKPLSDLVGNLALRSTDREDFYKQVHDIQDFIMALPEKNLVDSVNYFHPGYLDNVKSKEIYKRIFSPDFDTNSFAFDPLSRYYSHIIWKSLKILRMSFKYVNKEYNLEFIERFTQEFASYLKELERFLKESSRFGTETDKLMNSLLDNDCKFIEDFVMKEALNYGNAGGIEDIPSISRISAIPRRCEENNGECDDNRLKEIALRYIYDSSAINEIRGPWKFENLILNAKMDDIQYLSEAIAGAIPLEYREKPIIGILRSGSFMTYLFNIVTGNSGRIMHFKSTPLISVVPGSVKLPANEGLMAPLIFDESFKSGFTYEIMQEYICRKNEIKEFKPCFFSLTRILDYNRRDYPDKFCYLYSWYQKGMQTLSKDMIYVNGGLAPRGKDDRMKFYKIDDYLRKIVSYTDYASFKHEITDMIIIGSLKKRYDILRLFASVDSFFMMASYYFNEVVNEVIKSKEDGGVTLVYGSDYGYLMALAIILLSKVGENDKTTWEIQSSIQNGTNSYRKVFLDIELFTGRTFLRKAGDGHFDMTCVIAYNPDLLELTWLKKRTGRFVGILKHNQGK